MDLKAEFQRRFGPILFAERQRRDDAFINPPCLIAGVPIAPVTLHTWSLLDAIRSPLLAATDYHDRQGHALLRGALPLFPDELAHSIWVLSWEYREHLKTFQSSHAPERSLQWRQDQFIRRIADELHSADSIRDASETAIDHIRAAFADTPAGSGTAGQPLASHFAYITHNLATHYHWAEAYILHELPLNRLWQYLRLIEKANDPDHIPDNPSDIARGEIFQELIERQNAETRQTAMIVDPPTAPTL